MSDEEKQNPATEEEQPEVWVMREDGPEFAALIDSLTEEMGDAPDVCDVTVPTQLIAP